MNKHGKLAGKTHFSGKSGVEFNVPLIIFEEEACTICYCPALDLSGYGNNETEALESYKYVLKEYFDYTLAKRTLLEDLKSHGWYVKSLRKRLIPPDISALLRSNGHFRKVMENYDYKKISTLIKIPAFAA